MRNKLLTLFLGLVFSMTLSGKGWALPKLSEADVVATLTGYFSEFYKANAPVSAVEVSKVDVKVTNVQIGSIVKRQLQYGKLAEDIYPVRAEVEIIINYARKDIQPDTVIRGAKSKIGREGFAFFRNGFNEWESTYMGY